MKLSYILGSWISFWVVANAAASEVHVSTTGESQSHVDDPRRLQECGLNDGPCCSGAGAYETGYCYDQNHRICNSTGLCGKCGWTDEPCCQTSKGPRCDSRHAYCREVDSTCQRCGDTNKDCCPDGNGGYKCLDPFKYVCDVAGAPPGVTPTCENCGGVGQLCCDIPGTVEGKKCDSIYSYCDSTTNQCKSCGDEGEECCPHGGNECDDPGYFSCQDGTCQACGGMNQPCCTTMDGSEQYCDSFYATCNEAGICQECGKVNQECCRSVSGSPTCNNNDDSNESVCDPALASPEFPLGKCTKCGGNGEPICTLPEVKTCDSEFSQPVLGADGVTRCQSCGNLDQTCCATTHATPCRDNRWRSCHPVTNECEDCGDANTNQLCCVGRVDGKQCPDRTWSHCRDDGAGTDKCFLCGKSGQECCAIGPNNPSACNTGYSCDMGSNQCVWTG